MSSYSKSAATKELIIHQARKYFWEKGFERTRYEDLSVSGINPGLIHYHFKTKDSLACVVYNDLIEQCSALILEMMGNSDDVLLHIAGSGVVIWKFLDSSPNFRRFYSELANRRIPIQDAQEEDIYFIKKLNKEYQQNRSEAEIILLNRICASISCELVISFAENLTAHSAHELAIYESKSVFRVIGVDEELVNNALRKAEKIFSQYEFYMKDNFIMCYRGKNY